MQKVLDALYCAQQEVKHLYTNKENPHFKSTYADLNQVLSIVKPVLDKWGVFFYTTIVETATSPWLTTWFIHRETGEKLEIGHPLPQNTDPQKFGGAITYARRYSLTMAFALDDEDDDANAASEKTVAPKTELTPTTQQAKYVVGKPGGEDIGSKTMSWGKYKSGGKDRKAGKTFAEIGKDALLDYASFLRNLSATEGKPVSKNVVELETLLKQWNPAPETTADIPF